VGSEAKKEGWCAPYAPGLAAPSLSDPGGAPAATFNTRFEERLNGAGAGDEHLGAHLRLKRCPGKSDPISAHGSASFSPGTRRCWEGPGSDGAELGLGRRPSAQRASKWSSSTRARRERRRPVARSAYVGALLSRFGGNATTI
jgi:hypothetical protein